MHCKQNNVTEINDSVDARNKIHIESKKKIIYIYDCFDYNSVTKLIDSDRVRRRAFLVAEKNSFVKCIIVVYRIVLQR